MFHHKLHLARVFLQHLPEEGFKPRTVQSLVVDKDGNDNRRVRRPPERSPLQVEFVNLIEPDQPEGFLATAGDSEPVGPRQGYNPVEFPADGYPGGEIYFLEVIDEMEAAGEEYFLKFQ